MMGRWVCNHCPYSDIRDSLPASLTEKIGEQPRWLCAYIHDDEHLAGLALFDWDEAEKTVQIHFIHVLSTDRRKGAGTGLVNYLARTFAGSVKALHIIVGCDEKSVELDTFLRKTGFCPQELNGSVYYVNRSEWTQNVLPRIDLMARRAVVCTHSGWSELDGVLQAAWTQIFTSEGVVYNLRPDIYDAERYEKLFFHTTDGLPVGWVVVSLLAGHTVSLDVIYVLPAYRGQGTVFSLYAQTTAYVYHKWPQLDGLQFQLDTLDISLVRFYNRLLRNADYVCRKKFLYELPVSQTT